MGLTNLFKNMFRQKWNPDADIARSTGSDVRARLNSPEFTPDASGFLPSQRTGLNVFSQLLRGQSSGDWASRGFNLPANEDAVVGSALTQAAPNLFAIQNENRQFKIKAMLDSLSPQLQGSAINAQAQTAMAGIAGNVFSSALGAAAAGGGGGGGSAAAAGLAKLLGAAGYSTFGRGQPGRARYFDPAFDAQ